MISDIPQPSDSLRVQGAIRRAAASTGASFDYLLATAKRESALDPGARAQSSSATGLFQFIDSTWLQMVKEEGPAYGLENAAAAIERTQDGRYVAKDPGARQAILALRSDPDLNAMMAGAFTQKNRAGLQDALGRDPTAGELYMAHLLGLGGATKLITLAMSDGGADAALAFPRQAVANRAIFYGKHGDARTAAEVYGDLASRFDDVPSGGGAQGVTASAGDKMAANPAAWLAIPAHNAYALEAPGPFSGLYRSSASAPLSDHVVTTWARIENLARTGDPQGAEDGGLPLSPQRKGRERSRETRLAGLGADAPRGSFFTSLFAASWSAPVRTGKHWGG